VRKSIAKLQESEQGRRLALNQTGSARVPGTAQLGNFPITIGDLETCDAMGHWACMPQSTFSNPKP